jgi:hypothetical protein
MQHVQHLQNGNAVQVLVHAICGWSRWEQELVVDLSRVVPCNTVHMGMQAKLDTWLCKQAVMIVHAVNVAVGNAMHLAPDSRNSLEELQARK